MSDWGLIVLGLRDLGSSDLAMRRLRAMVPESLNHQSLFTGSINLIHRISGHSIA